MQSFELLLSLAQEAGIADGIAIGIGIKRVQSDINTDLCARCDVFHLALGLDSELHVVAIGPLEKTHTLDLLQGEGRHTLFFVSHEAKVANSTAIGEPKMLPIRIELPSSCFVFDAPVVVLKLGIALLPWLLLSTVLIEPGESRPRPISSYL